MSRPGVRIPSPALAPIESGGRGVAREEVGEPEAVALDHLAFPDLIGGPPYANAAPLHALSELAAVHARAEKGALPTKVLVLPSVA